MNELLIQVFDSSILDGVLTFHPLHHWSINLKVAFFFLKGSEGKYFKLGYVHWDLHSTDREPKTQKG